MKIKVFTLNVNGKIEFTPSELEKLLNDTFAEGQKECNCDKSVPWTNSCLNQPMHYQDEKAKTTCTTNSDKDVCECANPARKAYTATININPEDAKEMSKRMDEILNGVSKNTSTDAFYKLAKELNF